MSMMIKMASVAITGAVFALLLKKDSAHIALLIGAAAACVILKTAFDTAKEVAAFMNDVIDTSGVSSAVLAVMLKTAGAAIVGKYTADICRDAGQTSTATAVEIASAMTVLYITLPLMRTMLQMLRSFWGI